MSEPAGDAVLEEAASASPIADLSYRGYGGPLAGHALRWWTVALATIRTAQRKPWFWIWSVVSTLSYVFGILILFFTAQFQSAMSAVGQRPEWSSHFMNALPWALFFMLPVTMVVGAASIAADNRANALLVYLSKPVTKLDYLAGKWVGVFVLLLAVAFLPALLLYLYLLLSFRAEGFFTSDRLLLAKVLAVSVIAAAIHSSLILGFSAWSKSPTMAGALYAGFYFLGITIAPLLSLTVGNVLGQKAITIRAFAIPGLIQGLAYHVYHLFPEQHRRPLGLGRVLGELPQPLLWPIVAWAVALVVIPIVLARLRIRAVEVVRG
jgi:ABC-2 type transport system permease protein